MSVLSSLKTSRAPATAFAVLGAFWGGFAAQVPVIKAQIGADDAIFGLVLLGTAIGLMTPVLLAPRWDAWFRDRAMPLSSALFSLSFVLVGVVDSPLALFCVMVLVGATSGLTDVIMNARVSELEMTHHRPLMNANHGMFSLAYAISAVITGQLREISWEPLSVFILLAVFGVFATRWMNQKVVDAPALEEGNGGFPAVTVLLCGAVVLLAFMGEAAVETWSALHVERTLGGGAAEGALGPAMLGFTMALGRFSGQAVAERFRDVPVILWAAGLSVFGGLLAGAAVSPMMAYLGFATMGLGLSVIGPLGLALVGRMVQPSMRTKAISRAAVMGFVGFFVAPTVMGGVSQLLGLASAFFVMTGLIALLFPLMAVLKRRGA